MRRRTGPARHWHWATYLLCLFAAVNSSPASAEDLYRAAREQRAKYAGQLEELAAWCDAHKLPEQAKKTRGWLRGQDPNKLYVADLPQSMGRPPLADDAPPDLVEWDKRFWQLRRQYAATADTLARRAVRSGHASLAFELVLAAIRENPDHEAIRRLLGFSKFRGGWYTLYEIDKLRAGYVWDDKFGWIHKSQLPRYQQGQRLAGNVWVTAEEDARLHGTIETGWDIETEHYTIRTNRSIEAAVALGAKLERLYRVWKQLFVPFFANDAQLLELFDGRTQRVPGARRIQLPRLGIVYFRDRDDYVRALKPVFPDIGISIGIYVENTHRAYFFAGDDQDERTLYHEATHQLFHESRPASPLIGRRGNFWIVEGIAMYMESLRQEDGFNVLGGFDDLRMKAARYRLLHDNFYVPLSEFSAYSLAKLQSDPRIATLYSQAAGLTHFLVHYQDGTYRDALVRCLDAVYAGRDNPLTLSKLTDKSFQDLDAEYRKFIESGGPVNGKPGPAGSKPLVEPR